MFVWIFMKMFLQTLSFSLSLSLLSFHSYQLLYIRYTPLIPIMQFRRKNTCTYSKLVLLLRVNALSAFSWYISHALFTFYFIVHLACCALIDNCFWLLSTQHRSNPYFLIKYDVFLFLFYMRPPNKRINCLEVHFTFSRVVLFAIYSSVYCLLYRRFC